MLQMAQFSTWNTRVQGVLVENTVFIAFWVFYQGKLVPQQLTTFYNYPRLPTSGTKISVMLDVDSSSGTPRRQQLHSLQPPHSRRAGSSGYHDYYILTQAGTARLCTQYHDVEGSMAKRI